MLSAAEQCLEKIATAARKTADLFLTLQDAFYAYCDLHIAKEHLYIQICKSMVVAALFGKSFRNKCLKKSLFPAWPAPWPPACGGGVGPAPRKNVTASYSGSMGNQIQAETLPRLSQTGEGFLPEFHFRLKMVRDCADSLGMSSGARESSCHHHIGNPAPRHDPTSF